MNLETNDIKHIAKLARLNLTEDEISRYATELSVVFDYIDMLGEVDVSQVEPTTQVTGLMDVVREDIPEDISLEMRTALLDSFPKRKGDLLAVQAVFSDEQE